jgi:pyridoxamine 5'-phosphate oxidase
MEAPGQPPTDPLGLLRRWLGEAAAAAPGDVAPAAVLATVNGDAQPTTRTIEVRACDARGLVFFANLNSRKGRDLRARPAAAATLYWPSTMRQINLSGHVVFTSAGESDRLWAMRSPEGQAVATVSVQGAPLRDGAALRARVQALAAQSATLGRPLPRPPGHEGFVLVPAAIEFWHGHRDRIHRRWHYQREGDGWSHWLLQP